MGLERAAFTSTRLKVLDLRGMAIADIGLGWVAQVRCDRFSAKKGVTVGVTV